MSITKHIPSHIKINGYRALITYDGQPTTCFRCGDQGHQQTDCPRRRTPTPNQTSQNEKTWANIVRHITRENDKPQIAPGVMPQNKPKLGLTMNSDMTTPSNVQDNPDPILTETLMHDDTNQTRITDRTRSNNSNQPPTDNTVMDDLETNHETLTLQSPHPPATKWSDLLNETTENEITTERQKKKREQSNGTTRTDDDKVEKGNKNDEAQGYQPKPATSPQQAKKNKG